MKRSLVLAVLLFCCTAAVTSETEDVKDAGDGSLDKAGLDELLTFHHVFVKFYAPWCGHCKRLAPTWEKLQEIFAPEFHEVHVVKVNADAHRELATQFGVSGYPTLLFFPKGWKKGDAPERYDKARSLEAMIDFLNEKVGTMRLPDGTVKGRVPAADKLLEGFACEGSLISACAKAMSDHLKKHGIEWKFAQPREWDQRFINYYSNILRSINENAKDRSWVTREIERLGGIIENHKANVKRDDFHFFKGRRAVLEHLASLLDKAMQTVAVGGDEVKEAKKGEEKKVAAHEEL